MAEWLKAAVSKTVKDENSFPSSNLGATAKNKKKPLTLKEVFEKEFEKEKNSGVPELAAGECFRNI